jgi:hypothetical protein
VIPERRAPEVSTFDQDILPQASVYQMNSVPDSLLARTANPLSIIEGGYVGSFGWLGSDQNWGVGGPAGRSDQFIVRQVRPFYAPVAGTYTFRVTNDDGAWLWVNGNEVVKNVGLHPTTSVEGSVYLGVGLHTLAVKFFENSGGAYAGYAWRAPGDDNFSLVPQPPTAERLVTRFNLGQQVVVAADDMGGTGLRELALWINGSQQSSSTRPISLSLGSGLHTVEYQGFDKSDGAGNASGRVSVRYQVDPNLRVRRSFVPQIGR